MKNHYNKMKRTLKSTPREWVYGPTCECNPNGPWDCIPDCPSFRDNMKLLRKRTSKYVPRQHFKVIEYDDIMLIEISHGGKFRDNHPEYTSHLEDTNEAYFDHEIKPKEWNYCGHSGPVKSWSKGLPQTYEYGYDNGD